MGLFFSRKKTDEEREQEYYSDLYEDYYGKKLDHKLTRDEKFELDCFEEDEFEEDEADGR